MDIPKIIHYVWLGSGKMSPFIQDCVDSWKRVMPDYEIKCWNEQNFDVNSVVWVKEALENNISEEEVNIIEEIRIRINLPIIVKLEEKEKIIDYKVSTEDINYIFQKICENSIYAYQNQIANGFVTIKGGNRVGIVGLI